MTQQETPINKTPINPFETLSDEIIYQMCQNWDTPTLLNMSQSYSHVYQICSDVVLQRRIANKIKRSRFTKFIKLIDNIPVLVETYGNDDVTIYQYLKTGIEVVPWILPGELFESMYGVARRTTIQKDDDLKLQQLAINLVNHGYTESNIRQANIQDLLVIIKAFQESSSFNKWNKYKLNIN